MNESPEPDSVGIQTGLSGHWVQLPEGRWGCSDDAPIRGSYSLHHLYDNTEAGCDVVVFTHDPAEPHRSFSTSFRIRHGVPPSASNNWQVALLASLMGGKQVTGWIDEGVVLGVNLIDSDDLLKVWQIVDGEWHEIVSSSLNLEELAEFSGDFQIGLELDQEGRCALLFSGDPDLDPMTIKGKGEVLQWPRGRQLVVRYQYTSARDRNFWIDDLAMEGTFWKDTIAPVLLDYRVVGSDRLILEFSEPPVNPGPDLFRLENPSGKMWKILDCIPEADHVTLRFSEEIPNRADLLLHLSGICDQDGNCLEGTVVYVRRNEAVWGDVVFSELMADPEPGVGLPEQEYVELYNRSSESIDLNGWLCRAGEREYRLSGDHLWEGGILAPGGYGLLHGIALPNDGAELSLYNSREVLIHAVKYSVPWNGPTWKKEGGWSLESPDPDRLCNVSALWEYTQDVRGGTPGEVNSRNRKLEDDEPPVLLYTGYDAGLSLFSLYFSEPVRCSPWAPGQFPLLPEHVLPDSVVPGFPLSDRVDLWLPESFNERTGFSVKLPFLIDCSGNLLRAREAAGGAAPDPVPGAVVINEVMFHPTEGLPEYVELYNPGSKYQDLHALCLDAEKTGAAPKRPVPLSSHSWLLQPGGYVVLAAYAGQLREAYGPEASGKWVGVEPWPSLSDLGGSLYLTDRAGQTIDMMNFGEELHLDLLDQTAGVSLERIDPSLTGYDASVSGSGSSLPGSDPSNWHSAASIAGYATPGKQNSQWREEGEGLDLLTVNPKVFSPDNDGFEDILEVIFRPGTGGWVLTLWISDMKGREVCMLANNHVAGSASVYRWNGEQGDGWMVPEGIYIVHAGAYHEGTRKTWKKRVAVGLVYR
ncbi:MAG: lamin tail domain-containing protein [Bacteroidales bacterium]